MNEVQIVDGIVPLATFKTRASRFLKQAAETERPIVITLNGRAAGVLLSPAVYEELRRDRTLHDMAAEGAAALDAGDFIEQEEIEAWLKTWGTDSELPPPR